MAIVPPTDRTSLRVVPDAVCTFCGCMCDDIELTIDGNQITRATNACTLGTAGFTKPIDKDRPAAMVHGAIVPLGQAYAKAAEILSGARFPIVYGFSESTGEALRKALAIADCVGACFDIASAQAYSRLGMAFQSVGKVSCSLGEVKNRADLLVFWGTNPVESHPRHADRYSSNTCGLYTPNGRKDRHVVVVDIRSTASTAGADQFLQIASGTDFEVLWCLRALIKGIELPATIANQTGIHLEQLRELANRMKSCRFGVLFYGPGLSMTAGGQMNVEAAIDLAQELNQFTRFYTLPIGEKGNANGAENVVTWQTGYPCAVQLGRGYPRYNPGEFSASGILERGEADAALLVSAGACPELPPKAHAHLGTIPRIVLASTVSPSMHSADVAFSVAHFGLETTGTVYRTDDVPLTLRPAFDSPVPSETTVLEGIHQAIRALGPPL